VNKTFVNDDTVFESTVAGDRRFYRCKLGASHSGETQKKTACWFARYSRVQAPGRNVIGFIK
jgi:hypothetical protein